MRFRNILLSGAILLFAVSCSNNKGKLTYFKDIDTFDNFVPLGDYSVKIEPADELFISVTSSSPDATALYNLPVTNYATKNNLGASLQPSQQTYIVDPKGDIIFPLLGRIHVAGLTTEQLRQDLTERISKDVEDPIVRVELHNFRVNVMGEVNSPGPKSGRTPRYSILDAIADAGDLTVYGKRDNVLVIREENGQRRSERIDLTSADALNSPYFFLKQNDYVYVEPNDIRTDNSKYNQNNAFKLSVISTVVSAASVIASLVIALTIK